MADLIPDVSTTVPVVSPDAVTPVVAIRNVENQMAALQTVGTPLVVANEVAPQTTAVAPAVSPEELLKNNPDLQAYLNKITGDARKEGREKGKKDVLDSAGVDDPAKIKALFDAERVRQEAEMTAIQRFEAQLALLATEKQGLADQVVATQAQMRNTLLKGEIDKQAVIHNFIDVFDLKSRLDNAAVDIDLETGNVTGVAEQAKTIAVASKHLIKQPTPTVISATHVPATPKPASAQSQSAATDDEKRRKAWKPR